MYLTCKIVYILKHDDIKKNMIDDLILMCTKNRIYVKTMHRYLSEPVLKEFRIPF